MVKLLIVDDEADVCDFVKTFFEQRNCAVLTALNGEDALRILKRQMPSIILLDIRMKSMDGIEVLKRMKEIDKDVCVIMVTAVEDRDRMDEAFKLGAYNYITKPLVLEELESIVLKKTREITHGKGQ